MGRAYKCDNCLKLYGGTPAYKGDRIELCSDCLRKIKSFKNNKFFNNVDVNPHNKYSYNSGLCYQDGTPCWGLDINWCFYELEHGRNPY